MSEFVAYLEGACTELGELLEVYRGSRGWSDGGRKVQWTRVELEVALEGIRKTVRLLPSRPFELRRMILATVCYAESHADVGSSTTVYRN